MTQGGRINYRADIDGLRAIAVLCVIFFHYSVPGFPGGYVGVDIFFVISGYLITLLVDQGLQLPRFSLLDFYERRVRRILPALFLMLAATTAASLVLLPPDLVRYGRSLIATVFFASNFEFWRANGYFDIYSNQQPLLHLWSLAVEEQFYLLYPAFLFVIARFARRRFLPALLPIFLISLLGSLWSVNHMPLATFYLAPTRAWELLLGGMLALARLPKPARSWIADALALSGLGLIAYSVVTYNSGTSFPGAAALPPCLGAALVIHAGTGQGGVYRKFLAHPGIVFVGLLSYALYLWHWPVLIFAQYYVPRPLTGLELAGLMVVTAGAAYLWWRVVERPVRARTLLVSRRALFLFFGLASLVFLSIGTAMVAREGFPQRFGATPLALMDSLKEFDAPHHVSCDNRSPEQIASQGLCRLGDTSQPPSFILWGDSHAAALDPAMDEAARHAARSGYVATSYGCLPVLDVQPFGYPADCAAFARAVLAFIEKNNVRLVILSGRWERFTNEHEYRNGGALTRYLTDGRRPGLSTVNNRAILADRLSEIASRLRGAGRRVVLVSDVPEISRNVAETYAKCVVTGCKPDIRTPTADYVTRNRVPLAIFADLQKRLGTETASTAAYLCRDGICDVDQKGVPLYRDNNHLSPLGARRIIPMFAEILAGPASGGGR